jgi:hypothetical protein
MSMAMAKPVLLKARRYAMEKSDGRTNDDGVGDAEAVAFEAERLS